MTPKDKAEAYVRQQLPELMEESWKWAKIAGLEKAEEVRSLKIIGHPIQLQHWLRVLKKHPMEYVDIDKKHLRSVYKELVVEFKLTTGQPATEADYQAFCDIVGV